MDVNIERKSGYEGMVEKEMHGKCNRIHLESPCQVGSKPSINMYEQLVRAHTNLEWERGFAEENLRRR